MTWNFNMAAESQSCHVGLKSDLFLCFWVPREINSRFCSKTWWQMFLLVSGRHVGARLDGHQHGVSIAVTWIFAYLPFFLFPHSELYPLSSFDFDLFEIIETNWPFLKTTVTKREILTSSISSMEGVWIILHSSPECSFVRILQLAYFLVERSCLYNKISSLITISKSPWIRLSSSFNI